MVPRILLIEIVKQLKVLYTVNLEAFLGAKVTKISSFDRFKELYESQRSYHYIICRSNIEGAEIGKQVHDYLKDQGIPTPLMILGKSDQKFSEDVTRFEDSQDLKPIINTIAKDLGITAQMMAMKEVPDYYPIPTTVFANAVENICDIYIEDDEVDDSYKVIKNASEPFTNKELNELRTNGHKKLYIPAMDRLVFINALSTQIVQKLKSDDLSTGERLALADKSQEMVHDYIRGAGVSKETIEMAEQVMKSVQKVCTDIPKLSMLLNFLMADELSFRYRETQIVTYLSFHIVNNMEWGSKEQSDKLGFVSFFHDITLTTDEMARIRTDEELSNTEMDAKIGMAVKMHAVKAAKLVGDYPKVPLGADIIIKQHHGSRTGVGFAISQNISPLAIVFMIAQEWCYHILVTYENKKPDKKKIIEMIKDKYDMPAFKKVFPALDKVAV